MLVLREFECKTPTEDDTGAKGGLPSAGKEWVVFVAQNHADPFEKSEINPLKLFGEMVFRLPQRLLECKIMYSTHVLKGPQFTAPRFPCSENVEKTKPSLPGCRLRCRQDKREKRGRTVNLSPSHFPGQSRTRIAPLLMGRLKGKRAGHC